MTAPGKNLEFYESPFYTSKIAPCPELANAIARHLQNRPLCGVDLGGGIRTLEFGSGGRTYTVIFARRGQRLCLMNIFETKSAQSLNAYLARIRPAFNTSRGNRP